MRLVQYMSFFGSENAVHLNTKQKLGIYRKKNNGVTIFWLIL